MEKQQTLKKSQPRVVVFDFDGTLANGEDVFLDLLNSLAGEYGYQPVTHDQIPTLKNMGAKDFITKRLGLPLWNLLRIEKRFREEYGKRMDQVKIFPGIKELLESLKFAGFVVGILSSNSEESIHKFLKAHDLDIADFVYSGSSLFGKTRVIKNMLKDQGLESTDIIYVGDEVRDVESCKSARVPIIAVGWGLNSSQALHAAGADSVVESPADILHLLNPENSAIINP
jgi:HAD superfamily hydrolase (TIGR01549 family)